MSRFTKHFSRLLQAEVNLPKFWPLGCSILIFVLSLIVLDYIWSELHKHDAKGSLITMFLVAPLIVILPISYSITLWKIGRRFKLYKFLLIFPISQFLVVFVLYSIFIIVSNDVTYYMFFDMISYIFFNVFKNTHLVNISISSILSFLVFLICGRIVLNSASNNA